MPATKGTYTFNAMMVEPGASLNIDNRQGPVFIYLRDGFTFRGTITPAATQANVLFGIAGTNPVVIDSAFTGIIVAPKTSITLATVATQHKGAFFAQSILARKNQAIVLNALDSANFCTGSDACSSFCPCAAGASKTCTDNSSCQAGSVCGSGNGAAFGLPSGSNVCWAASCQAMGGIGSQCSRFPQACQSDTDCPSGDVCGQANGAKFLFAANRVCWPAQCATDPVGAGCGTVQMPCGFCTTSCAANCATKPSNDQQCANRQCGVDPAFGASCGTCAAGQFCNNAGQCQSQTKNVIPNEPPTTGSGAMTVLSLVIPKRFIIAPPIGDTRQFTKDSLCAVIAAPEEAFGAALDHAAEKPNSQHSHGARQPRTIRKQSWQVHALVRHHFVRSVSRNESAH